MIGKTLGHYEITGQLGKGGMGEVYRAHDTKLNRDVALKVLPAEFANDAERMGRFKREAQLLASLNHTNIAAIYGLEESGDVRALVMELVEGETLADYIAGNAGVLAGKNAAETAALPAILKIALQISEALEAAHEKGIIHRDLKPANIKVTPNGTVKVLDFGLAKALEGEAAATDASQSPTLSLAATKAGIILGTAAYMSPEQARGSAVDKRCDIWSFGVVLFEMLTGKQLFSAETVSDTLAAVLRSGIDWSLLPANTPAGIRTLLRRCLTKDRKQRLQAIGEARIAIEEYLANPAGAAAKETVRDGGRNRLRERLTWGGAIVLLAGALIALSAIHFRETSLDVQQTRLQVVTPPTSEPTSIALSPDGRLLAFVATTEGQQRLFIRPLDAVAAQPLPGTEGATNPFWSPDSKSIGFFAEDKLKRIDISGGGRQELARVNSPLGGTWNRSGIIVYAPSYFGSLFRIPATGGNPVAITKLDPPHQVGHWFPQFLPDGRHLLFFAEGSDPGIFLGSIDSPESRRLMATESAGSYVPPGYLLFMSQGILFAQRLDASLGELAGERIPLADSVSMDSRKLGGFSSSETGVLAYRTGAGNSRRRLAWFDRAGTQVGTIGEPDDNNLLNPNLSPDGQRVAVDLTNRGNRDVSLIEADRGIANRFTFDAGEDFYPVWSPDGSKIVFCSGRKQHICDLYQRASSGAGSDELLLESSLNKFPYDLSRDGKFLLFLQIDMNSTGRDLWVLPLFGDRKESAFLNTRFNEWNGQFSPDGRWVAYESDESAAIQVYVQPFPRRDGGKWQISIDGGSEPRWSRDGKELFYIAPDGKLMAAPIKGSGQTLEAGAPMKLFQTRIVHPIIPQRAQYAIDPNGQRFLINITANESTSTPITIVTNWARALKK